jgi:hypothetical protein
MTFNYASIASLASAQLEEFGQTVLLRNHPTGTYDPGTGENTTPAPVDVERKAALFDFAEGLTEENGTLIQIGDKRCLMEAGVEPSPEDQLVTAAGEVYSIARIGAVAPAGVVVIYKLHLRRG